ncbi:MAG: LAGLIDADG family homing endonuclease [bacterium]|nr:LAGLIDADG family homing endonuclease [bacterium]
MLKKDYIVGLVDGEGSFTVYIREVASLKVKRRVKAEPRFYLKLIEKDKSILDELKSYFGCGHVYFQKDNRRNHQQCYRFEVTHRDHLRQIIIPFFKVNPLRFPSKRRDFELFCQMLALIEEGVHHTQAGLARLAKLKAQMH